MIVIIVEYVILPENIFCGIGYRSRRIKKSRVSGGRHEIDGFID